MIERTSTPPPDLAEINRAIRLLVPAGTITELRVPNTSRGVIAGYFSDPEALARAAAGISGKAPGVYVTLNEIQDGIPATNTAGKVQGDLTGNKQIARRRWLYIDFDPKRPSGTSSTDAEHSESLRVARECAERLVAERWPEAVLADSGNGAHLLYAIDLPADDITAKLVKNCLLAIQKRHETDQISVDIAVHNAARISKLYGTVAAKGQPTHERPHRISRIISGDSSLEMVPESMLRGLAAEVEARPAGGAADGPAVREAFARRFGNVLDVEGWMVSVGLRFRPWVERDGSKMWTFYGCPFDPEHKAKDAAVFQTPEGKITFNCFHDGCYGRKWTDIREMFEPGYLDRRRKAEERAQGRPVQAKPQPSGNPSGGPSGNPKANGHAAAVQSVQSVPDEHPPEESYDTQLTAIVDEIITSGDVTRCYEERLFWLAARSEDPSGAVKAKNKLRAKFGTEMTLSGDDGAWLNRLRQEQRRAKIHAIEPDEKLDGIPDGLPRVLVSGRQLREVSADSLEALNKSNEPPYLFVRSGEIVHVVRDEFLRPSVCPADQSWLRGALSRGADFVKGTQDGGVKGVFPPIEVVQDISSIEAGSLPFPPLASVVEVPVLRADGTVLARPGYDPASSVYYAPSESLQAFSVPDYPTQADAYAARGLILEAIGEFPYADESSQANVFGLLLTPILRPAILGCVPLAAVDAPEAGTGKSLLIDVLSMITTGRPSAMVPYPFKEEEMVKQIGASLASGRQLIVFDNLEGELRSPSLALALTAKEYEARILGFSRNMTVPNVSTWVVTGNNIRPAGDMARRCYHIRLDAQKPKPYTGRVFRHPNLLQWIRDNRAELLRALLVMARYWYASGKPNHVTGTVGSFEDWHTKVGSVIKHSRISGFLDNYAVFIDQEDESPRQWEVFLAYLFHRIFADTTEQTREFSVAELTESIQSSQGVEFKNLLPAEIADCLEKKGANHRIVIGKLLRSRRQKRFGHAKEQYWLERSPAEGEQTGHKGTAMWKVRRAGE